MKLVLSLSASLAVGHILSGPKRSLVARGGQQLTNPDNEPDYEDFTTGSKTPKSRVLSGVGPVEANRWFDWDESCSDADQRTKILLQKGLPSPVRASSPNKDNQKYIFNKDPATGNGAAQAIATLPYDTKFKSTIEPRYSFEKSSSITFCPAFFNNDTFPNIDVVAGFGGHTLDKVDCAERVLLHEYMHLQWIRNMPGSPDYIGYFKAADYARVGGWGFIKVNPDNYAWLALYAYFNNNNQGCGSDVWP
ncbi:hypothetical protein F4677DRAFT_448600 [Hypoxylon crocopeplum]|nr:hypothetical protein F4677DRAFT_448600 [Hypoxylon crocopeplum]